MVPENTKKEISWKIHDIVTVIITELFLKEMFSSFSHKMTLGKKIDNFFLRNCKYKIVDIFKCSFSSLGHRIYVDFDHTS